MQPPVTVVSQPVAELGRTAGLRLLRRLEGDRSPARRIRLEARLIVRGSCGASRVSVTDLLAELVAADSTNPDLEPGGAGEAAVAAILAARMAAIGLEVDVWDAAPGRPNVVGRLRGTGGGRSLMFCGHTDVVGAAPEAFVPSVRDGRMHGRGTCDMKAGIAAAVAAAERIGRRPAGRRRARSPG